MKRIITSISVLLLSLPCFSNVLEVDIYTTILRPSAWQKSEVDQLLVRVNEVYSQCDIKLNLKEHTDSYWEHYPGGRLWMDIDNPRVDIDYPDGAVNFVMQSEIKKRPLVIFVDDWDYAHKTNALSAPVDRVNHLNNGVMNTIWMTRDIISKEYLAAVDESYSVLAHELGHVIGNMEHFLDHWEPNLMHFMFSRLNGDLKPAQCEKFRKSIAEGQFTKNNL